MLPISHMAGPGHVLVEFRIRIVVVDGSDDILQELLIVRGVLQGLEVQSFGCLG